MRDREAFEAWAREQGYALIHDGDIYLPPDTFEAFEGWQAALAYARQQEQQKARELVGKLDSALIKEALVELSPHQKGINCGLNKSAELIRQHFGLEEV